MKIKIVTLNAKALKMNNVSLGLPSSGIERGVGGLVDSWILSERTYSLHLQGTKHPFFLKMEKIGESKTLLPIK
jgi:hypothetical protein